MTIPELLAQLHAVQTKAQTRNEAIALLESKGYIEQAAMLTREAMRETKGELQRLVNCVDAAVTHR